MNIRINPRYLAYGETIQVCEEDKPITLGTLVKFSLVGLAMWVVIAALLYAAYVVVVPYV